MASTTGMRRLLTLTALADENMDDYDLIGFRGREALSEPFLYNLEIRARELPASLGAFVGKLAEWTLSWADGEPRTFAGRIYEARLAAGNRTLPIIQLVVRPAYWAASYARGTHFIQEKSSIEIFDAVTAKVPGLVTDKQATADKRAYAVRYDESELEFLDRMLAQDGIYYYYAYDRSSGAYRHKMRLANAASGYMDVPDDAAVSYAPGGGNEADTLGIDVAAFAGTRRFHGLEVNKLDTPFRASATAAKSWSSVYEHGHDVLAGGTSTAAVATARAKAHTAAVEQGAELISGTSMEPAFFAGGRVALDWTDVGAPRKVVLVSVEHVAIDDSRQGSQSSRGTYSNAWTAIDAATAFSPAVPVGRRRAYGPVLGVVKNKEGAEGEAVIDSQSRVPVTISQAVESDPDKPFDPFIWLPVAQQWAHSTHGAQFFPRIGTRVIVDFLYGDPDLPIVVGTMYTPTQKYPFDPASNATQTGWKSVTDKNGGITQNLLFEDKPGAEEIQLYTGRDYRRLIDNDDWGTIKHDQTLIVEHDQKEDINHDQTLTVKNDQAITVENNRTVKVTGVEETTVQKTRTTTVAQKSLHESMQEIELKVGPSSIKLTMDKIVITSPQIEIKGTATVSVEAGAMLSTKGAIVQHSSDGPMTIKGVIVMIN
jgi:type VI secretion system secreted protein VgrG